MARHSGLWRHLAAATAVMVFASGCSFFNPNPPVLVDPETLVEDASDAKPVKNPKPLKPTVKWRKCGKGLQCGKVKVPIDYDRPKGEKIELALIRLPAPNRKRRIGSLIVNPGGPGGSGVDYVRSAALRSLPAELRVRFDIVGFDPRGVGRSAPVSCGGETYRFLGEDLVADDPSEVGRILTVAESVAAACERANGTMLEHMSTDDVARDVDRIRRAVGDRQLTYLGYSYGSTIGLWYAERFPNKIRALVLDGPVDPAIDLVQRARDQANVLDKVLRDFFKECRQFVQCHNGQRGVSLRRFKALVDRLESRPLPASLMGRGVALRKSEALLATVSLLKNREYGWPLLWAGLSMAQEGDGSLLLAVSGSGDAPIEQVRRQEDLAPLLAVNCLDIPAPKPSEYPAAARDLVAKSENFGSVMLLLSAACAYWPVPPQREPAVVRAPDAPPAIVVGTTGDPTTPYEWAEAVAKNLKGARLVTRDGRGHTAFGKVNVCTDRTITAYLVNLVLPANGAACS